MALFATWLALLAEVSALLALLVERRICCVTAELCRKQGGNTCPLKATTCGLPAAMRHRDQKVRPNLSPARAALAFPNQR